MMGSHIAWLGNAMDHADSNNTMLIEERRQHVLALIQRDGRVLVSELSDRLGISRITIRKNLDYLEPKGLVQRTHGGALPPQSETLLNPTPQTQQPHQLQDKQ